MHKVQSIKCCAMLLMQSAHCLDQFDPRGISEPMSNFDTPNQFLTELFNAAVDAADPAKIISDYLPPAPKGRTIVIGAGKASSQMGKAFEDAWEVERGTPLEGVIVTRYDYACECKNFEVLEAAHPVPDEAGLVGAKRLIDAVSNLTPDDLVVALISGGGSSLLPCPADGLTLADEIAVNEALLASGAPISAMNTVRKHISAIKGGRLAVAAYPAKVVSLLVSDIPGDHPQFIASGPTVADEGTRHDALAIISQYEMKLPDASLEAAQKCAEEAGIETHILSDAIEGEAREAARTQAAIAKEILLRDRPFKKPVLLLSGGETTVTLKGNGKGGRNTEFLLSFALEISGETGIHSLCADTDGIDGSEDNAGAFVNGDTATQIRQAGLDPVAYLQNNDAWTAFEKVDALFIPGPTGTNVNDFRAIFISG
ncbi:putative hydroxypyruvate reductase [Nymphon striatum]|nr:putative hydroxypyruvate reductase [Nymphon striatum]